MKNDPETHAAYQKRWFHLHPEKRRQYNRRYYAKNAEKLRADARAKRNSALSSERHKRFRDSHPGYDKQYRRKRKLKVAWLKFTTQCARSREVLSV